MQSPFSITVFATTGDPQGIRHVDKSNWSGYGVVFPKELFANLKHEPGFNQAGVYVLVGNAAEETIYIGEADPLGERLRKHVANKEGWDWGIYFFDQNHKIGKTEVQFLEHALVNLAQQYNRAVLLNKNTPMSPTMSPVARATAQAFFADMLLILPMLGINAFTPPKPEDKLTEWQRRLLATQQIDVEAFDTLVVPVKEEGMQKTFLEEQQWFAVRIQAKHLHKIKHLAAYQVAPVSAITHIADIEKIEPYENTGKYLLSFRAPASMIKPVLRREGCHLSMQSPRYALRDTILAAKYLDQIWP
ncbi:MAG: GIY-YIG nuclease family protein [Thiolinea sp.]